MPFFFFSWISLLILLWRHNAVQIPYIYYSGTSQPVNYHTGTLPVRSNNRMDRYRCRTAIMSLQSSDRYQCTYLALPVPVGLPVPVRHRYRYLYTPTSSLLNYRYRYSPETYRYRYWYIRPRLRVLLPPLISLGDFHKKKIPVRLCELRHHLTQI